MSYAQTKPSQIVVALQQKFPADNFTVRHVYNYQDNMRWERLDGCNPAQQVLHEVVQRGYVYWTTTNMDGCICQMFCAHPTSLQLFRTWPYVVGMDSTYKTNRYNMPLVEIVGVTPCNNNFLIGYALVQNKSSVSYQWVLECFRNILGEFVQLSAIVTDRDFRLTKALAQVFPQTSHLLCTWHINKDQTVIPATKWRGFPSLPSVTTRGGQKVARVETDLADRCGCALRTTHGLPCGHSESLCEELRRRDRSFVRDASCFIQLQLQPEDSDVQEPPVNSNVRGCPRNSSTRREAYAWEYTQQGSSTGSNMYLDQREMMFSGTETADFSVLQIGSMADKSIGDSLVVRLGMRSVHIPSISKSTGMASMQLIGGSNGVNTTTSQPLPELVIVHLGNYRHYIHLEMQHDFLVPPIIDRWFQIRTPSVHGFDYAYARRRAPWDERVRVQQSHADNSLL
ncbi:Protein FAR1-RELATED SEQUENCE 5 [Bienertia sinuspersici]